MSLTLRKTMYTATMNYRFKTQDFDKACKLWENHVLSAAKTQAGFVRMQFLTNSPQAMAIGTWKAKADAEAFMKTGVFVRLMAELEAYCDGKPTPQTWELKYFTEA